MTDSDLDRSHLVEDDLHPVVAQRVLDMRRTLIDTVATAIGGHRRCALVMFRDGRNLGDAAIWLGALHLLDELGVDVRYAQPMYRLHPGIVRAAIGDGPVLINGGGSFGDTYRRTQRFTYRVIGEFPDRQVVLLPQTVRFRQPEMLEEAKQVLGRHPDVTLICRERAGFELASSSFDCTVLLAPDLAVVLGPQTPVRAPTVRALRVLRRDDERLLAGRGMPPRKESVDWADVLVADTRLRWRVRREELLFRAMRRVGAVAPFTYGSPIAPIATAERLSAARVGAANALLSQARCVVTDRLHAHLLAVMLGRPSIVRDNSFGKVRWFHDTWTSGLPGVAWADTDADVEAALDRLVPE